ncbi:MAG: hypothetical protein ACE5GC_04750, partial [Acidimicrobiia bacterium]
GGTGDDVAITGFGTGVPGEGPPRVFVEVANLSGRVTVVDVELSVDGLAVGSVVLELDPQQRVSEIVAIDAGPGQVVEAALVDHEDANPLNDASALVLAGSRSVSVTIAGEGSAFLEGLVAALPGVAAPTGSPPEIVILDGGSAAIVDRPAWLIAPRTPPDGVTVTGRVENPVITYQRPSEPLLDGLDLGSVAIAEADIVEAPGWLPLLQAGDVPLVLLGEVDGQRAVYFTFDLVRSNLPVQVAFPILGTRIIDYLAGNRLTTSATAVAGTSLALAPPRDGSVVVTLPDGSDVAVTPGVVQFGRTATPGVYRVTYHDADGAESGGFTAARQFAAAESPGEPRQIATEVEGAATLDEAAVLRDWAPLVLALLLVVVLTEWWVAFGRPLPVRRSAA